MILTIVVTVVEIFFYWKHLCKCNYQLFDFLESGTYTKHLVIKYRQKYRRTSYSDDLLLTFLIAHSSIFEVVTVDIRESNITAK